MNRHNYQALSHALCGQRQSERFYSARNHETRRSRSIRTGVHACKRARATPAMRVAIRLSHEPFCDDHGPQRQLACAADAVPTRLSATHVCSSIHCLNVSWIASSRVVSQAVCLGSRSGSGEVISVSIFKGYHIRNRMVYEPVSWVGRCLYGCTRQSRRLGAVRWRRRKFQIAWSPNDTFRLHLTWWRGECCASPHR